MSEEMRKYTYIQSIGNGKHLIQDDYLMAFYPNEVSIKIAKEVKEDEIGVKIKDLKLAILSTYTDFLRKK
jgi:hypothetical protein|tara:strand:- start:1229 stop:1438 length:210 start_codon:yes stop_codon:yes gene_type:complete